MGIAAVVASLTRSHPTNEWSPWTSANFLTPWPILVTADSIYGRLTVPFSGTLVS
jgi:hypothetical protein